MCQERNPVVFGKLDSFVEDLAFVLRELSVPFLSALDLGL